MDPSLTPTAINTLANGRMIGSAGKVLYFCMEVATKDKVFGLMEFSFGHH
jgi:hypothetical protein